MKLKLTGSILFLVLLISILLQEFSFSVGCIVIPCYFFTIIIFIFYLLCKKQNILINQLKKFYKTASGKRLVFFILWILLGILFSLFSGHFIFKSFFTNFLGNFFCSNLFPFLITMIVLPYIIGYKKFCKYFLLLYFFVFLLGCIEYVANTYNITYIQNVFLMFVNRIATKTGLDRVFVEAYGKFRISGICHNEPGALAAFIFVSCPILYFLCTSKMRLFKNNILDFSIKISTFLMSIFCFIGTQSPINLCFMLIFLSIVVIYKLIYTKRIYKIIFFSIFTTFVTVLLIYISSVNIDISATYLNRIVTTMQSFTSMTVLVHAEPSLATRIGNYMAAFSIGLKYPICGIGYGNIMSLWPQEVLKLNIPITSELYTAASLKLPTAVGTMFWKLIAETGFIGMFLFYIFLFSIVNSALKIKNKFFAFEKELFNSLIFSLILYISVSYYIFLQPIMWVYFGALQAMILNKKSEIIQQKKDK